MVGSGRRLEASKPQVAPEKNYVSQDIRLPMQAAGSQTSALLQDGGVKPKVARVLHTHT